MPMRMIGDMVAGRCSPMMQCVVDVFLWQLVPDPLWQQRSGDHAQHADAQADQLRWYQAGLANQEFDQ